MVRLTVVIDDQFWPQVRMTATREGIDGSKTATVDKSSYDTCYTVFENTLHNHLRPMCSEINNRRLGKPVLR
jgi:hypothetical protein